MRQPFNIVFLIKLCANFELNFAQSLHFRTSVQIACKLRAELCTKFARQTPCEIFVSESYNLLTKNYTYEQTCKFCEYPDPFTTRFTHTRKQLPPRIKSSTRKIQ